MKLILASGSPRRSEILKNAGYEFVVKPTSADESLPGGISPEDAVKLLSERKADAAKTVSCSAKRYSKVFTTASEAVCACSAPQARP